MTVISARIVDQRVWYPQGVAGKASLRKPWLTEVCVWEEGGKLPAEGKDLILTQKRGQEREAYNLGISSKGSFSQKGQPNAQTHQTGKSLQTKPPLVQQLGQSPETSV